MTVAAPAADPTTPEAPERRTYAVTCQNPACRHTFTRRLRKGASVTCPVCKVTQPGPARLEELERRELARLERNRKARERYRAEKNGNGAEPPEPPVDDHDGAGDQSPPAPPPDDDPPPPPSSSAPPPRAPGRWSMRGLLTGEGW